MMQDDLSYIKARFSRCFFSHSSASLMTLCLSSISPFPSGYAGSNTYSRLARPFADFAFMVLSVDRIGSFDNWEYVDIVGWVYSGTWGIWVCGYLSVSVCRVLTTGIEDRKGKSTREEEKRDVREEDKC